MSRRPRILLVYALPHSGHSQAAAAVHEELERQGACVEEYNFQEQWERLGKKVGDLQKWIVEHTPWFWRHMHGNTNYQEATDFVVKSLVRWDVTGLLAKIESFRPDAIVATHMLPLRMLGEARLSGYLRVPLFAVTTDLWAHAYWAHEGVDRYFASTGEAKKNLIDQAIRESKIQVTGLPIRSAFSHATMASKRSARTRLGLQAKVPHVTVVGGHNGVFPFQALLKVLSTSPEVQHITWTFLFGSAEKELKKAQRFLQKRSLSNVRVSGFTREIETFFLASDLVVTKPGGLSTSEITACGVPLVLCAPIPGQEEGNARILCEVGAAIREDDPDALVQCVQGLLRESARLKEMVREAHRLIPGHSAERVSRKILQYLSRKNP